MGVIPLGGQGAAFVAASAAFIVDFILSVGISLFTTAPNPETLKGLVYSETPKEVRQDPLEHTYPWYRRTLPLAGLSLVMVTVLNILF